MDPFHQDTDDLADVSSSKIGVDLVDPAKLGGLARRAESKERRKRRRKDARETDLPVPIKEGQQFSISDRDSGDVPPVDMVEIDLEGSWGAGERRGKDMTADKLRKLKGERPLSSV